MSVFPTDRLCKSGTDKTNTGIRTEVPARSSSSNDAPRFFKHDIIAILKEKNELKERVIELEEEVEILKREIARLSNSRAHSIRDVSRRTQFEGAQKEGHSAAATAFRKPLKYCNDGQQYVSNVIVTGYKKKARYYVYIMELTWSDGQRYEIYRRYGEFFTFQHTLLQLFPEQNGKGKSAATKIIPTLPTIDNALSLFGRTNTESIIKSRLATVNEYCQILLLHTDTQVSRSPHVLTFFGPAVGDTQLSKLKRKRSDMDLSIFSVYPQNMPAGSLFEEHVVLADYEAVASGEISAKAGDRVKVIKKEDSGWWLVTKSVEQDQDEIGYISADYLKPYRRLVSQDSDEEDIQKYLGFICRENTEQELEHLSATPPKYVAIEDYCTEDPRQLCLRKEETVLVIEMSEDGWWLALSEGKQGWVPASYLQLSNHQAANGNASNSEVGSAEEYYVAIADYHGEHPEDISFPEGARVKVIEKSSIGWWVVRYQGHIGIAPASFLGAHPIPMKGHHSDDVLQNSLEMGHSISGILTPPPRSKVFMVDAQRRLSELSSSLSDENYCLQRH